MIRKDIYTLALSLFNCCFTKYILHRYFGGVKTLDSVIRWIVIYPVDSAIQRLNNWGKTSNVQATVKRRRET